MDFDIMTGASDICQLESLMSLLPELREMLLLEGEDHFSKFLRNASFY